MKTLWLLTAQASATGWCLQTKMDTWCQNLGTDDNLDVGGDHKHCNNVQFARFDNKNGVKEWRCFEKLLDSKDLSCVDDFGKMVACNAGDLQNDIEKRYCTQNASLKWVIISTASGYYPLKPDCPISAVYQNQLILESGSCLQTKIDTWCQNLGIDDDVVVGGDHHDCNTAQFARFDTTYKRWRCFEKVLDTMTLSCVDEFGGMVECYAPDLQNKIVGKYCTRDSELKALIATGCEAPPTSPVTAGKPEWVPIYSQTGPSSFVTDNCKLGNCNFWVDGDNFIYFDKLKSVGEYRFKMIMEEKDTGDITTLEWTQLGHPLAFSDTDMKPSDIIWMTEMPTSWRIEDPSKLPFKGLSLSNAPETLLDGDLLAYVVHVGAVVIQNRWWFSIGYNTVNDTVSNAEYAGGQPVLRTADETYKLYAQKTQLFVEKSGTEGLGSCLQTKIDTWCQNLGIDDDVVVGGDHHDCNTAQFARFDTTYKRWRCFEKILDTMTLSCVDEFGGMVDCYAPDLQNKIVGKYCTRDSELKALIASGCDKDDKFNYDKDPEVILDKRAARLAKFMDDNLSAHPNFIARLKNKVEKVVDRMVLKFHRLNGRCDLWSDPEEDDDTIRYDQHNPCKAVKQLTKGFVKWSTIYNLNCNGKTTNKMLQSVERNMIKIEEMLKKKLKIC